MSAVKTISPRFVEFVPKDLEEAVLYVSIPYGTTVHKCACGCGSKITLPINPAKWRLLWDGERISLWPSVGNWSYPCRSHYWIEQNRIEWALEMSQEEIDSTRARDRADRKAYLASRREQEAPAQSSADERRGLLDRLRGLFQRS